MSEKENNIANDSAYAKSLTRLVKLAKNYCIKLHKDIYDNKEYSELCIIPPVLLMVIEIICLILLCISEIAPVIFGLSSLALISGIKIFSLISKKYIKKISMITPQFEAIKNLYVYLETELEIAKEHNNLLSNNQILENEKRLHDDMNCILENNYVQTLNDKYLEEYRKNMIIIDSLENLDNNKKQEYLSRIYQQMRIDFTKTNIDIDELESPNENSIILKLPDKNNNITGLPEDIDYAELYPNNGLGFFATECEDDIEKTSQLQKRYPN